MDDPTLEPPTIEMVVDRVVRRLHLFAKAGLALAALFALLGGVIARAITKDVKDEVADLRTELQSKAKVEERLIQVVELAVIAVVEPDSTARAEAINELHRRRRVAAIGEGP